MADKIKFLIAALLLGGAFVAFYTFSDDVALVIRVLGLLAAVGIAGFIAAKTEAGGSAVAFTRGAVVEVRKVVWPTRKETVQTTMMVMAMVVIVGIILWVFDWFLAWGVQLLTGQGS
jgi:preprotein translocase subunit SecE